MYFVEGRIQRVLEDLSKLRYWYSQDIKEIYVRYDESLPNEDLWNSKQGWGVYSPGTPWGRCGKGEYAIFKFKVQIPSALNGKKTVLRIRTNRTG